MNRHEISLARSLAYHREVARRLERCEELLVSAHRQARRLAESKGRASAYGRQWLSLLDGGRDELLRVLTTDTEEARTLRSCTPFAGALTPQERWAMWKAVAAAKYVVGRAKDFEFIDTVHAKGMSRRLILEQRLAETDVPAEKRELVAQRARADLPKMAR